MNEHHHVARLASEFRQIFKSLDDLDRRMASTLMNGRVAEIRGTEVRLELLPADRRTGKPFLSPWVQLQEAAGQTATRMPVKVGDPMRLLSPNGVVGSQSLALRDGYTEDAPAPGEDGEFVIAFGDVALRSKGGDLRIVAPGKVRVESAELRHNARNVGDSHKHLGVIPGGGKTAEPDV